MQKSKIKLKIENRILSCDECNRLNNFLGCDWRRTYYFDQRVQISMSGYAFSVCSGSSPAILPYETLHIGLEDVRIDEGIYKAYHREVCISGSSLTVKSDFNDIDLDQLGLNHLRHYIELETFPQIYPDSFLAEYTNQSLSEIID
ncbi:hypothetical protein KC678_01505 [Candidatus Dojkabacteria bacterium]|uniref:Uncharacterized protein n=1 Tax=Candidatus Dojkabacteria bacterium TaxID=2099670 RepID=A0A955ICF0_9BACT|nr:hypothetical protein [Candidatus Dojkabacteria bacterium]